MKKRDLLYFLVIAVTFSFAERTLLSQQSVNALKTGSKVPEFKLYDQDGKVFDLKNVLGKQNLIIYFYVKDETPGCTKESCAFRDQFEVFQQAQAMIIGISAQSVESHKQFAGKYKLPFTLLSDPEDKVRKLFGVQTGGAGSPPGRVTFVVDKTGTVKYVFDALPQAAQHVDEALKVLKELK